MITGTNAFSPSLSVGDGTLTVTIQAGVIFFQGKSVSIPLTNIVCATNATTSIYIDLGTRALTSGTAGFPVGCYPVATAVTNLSGLFVSLTDNRPDINFNGLEFLGFGTVAAGIVTTTIQPRDYLKLLINVGSYGGGGDIASLQFNLDTGNNYWWRHMTAAAGAAVWANTQGTTTNLIQLADAAVNQGRTIEVDIINKPTKSKSCTIRTQTLTGAVGTAGIISLGGGEWVNTTVQITSITLTDVSLVGFTASMAIFGKNFS